MNEEIQFEDIKLAFVALWKNRMLICAVTLFGILLGLLLTSNKKNEESYIATATVYCATYASYSDANSDVAAMINYSDVVTSKKVCQRAESIVGNSSIDSTMIQRMIGTEFSSSSYIMKVYANTDDPDIAIEVANAVAEAFVIEISSITGNNSIQLLDKAEGCYRYTSNTLLKTRVIFGFLACFAICAVIMCKELFSNSVKSITQCIGNDDADIIIGIIPESDK